MKNVATVLVVLSLPGCGWAGAQDRDPAPVVQHDGSLGKGRVVAKDAATGEEILSLIRQLDHEDPLTRDRATEDLVAMGKPVIPVLRSVLAGSASPEAKLRAQIILDQVDWPEGGTERDDLQLILKPAQTDYLKGADLELRVRLKHSGKADKTLVLKSDGQRDSSPEYFRTVIKGPAGEIVPIGFFDDLQGPTELRLSIPADSTIEVALKSYLGRHFAQAIDLGEEKNIKEPLEPGRYEIAVVLGDAYAYLQQPTQLCSNWVKIEIKVPE